MATQKQTYGEGKMNKARSTVYVDGEAVRTAHNLGYFDDTSFYSACTDRYAMLVSDRLDDAPLGRFTSSFHMSGYKSMRRA
jgi:hypothetical protein